MSRRPIRVSTIFYGYGKPLSIFTLGHSLKKATHVDDHRLAQTTSFYTFLCVDSEGDQCTNIRGRIEPYPAKVAELAQPKLVEQFFSA